MAQLINRRHAIAAVAGATAGPWLAGRAFAQAKPPRRVFIVNSQEEGHPCGEPQARGVLEALAAGGWSVGRNLTVKRHYMDRYRANVSPDLLRQDGQRVLARIDDFKPDIVFALDDASIQFVMMELVGRSDLALVFSGMNAQPEMYNARKTFMASRARPGGQVTGVYERLYALRSLRVMMEAVPRLRGGKAVMITDGTGTGAALARQFELELDGLSDVAWRIQRVNNWMEYTGLVEVLGRDPEVKAIYPIVMTLGDDGGTRYTAAEIYDWTLANWRKPELAANYFFARMGLLGGAVVNFGSMGRLAGRKGVQILDGASPGEIPIEDSPDFAIVFNIKRARDLGIEIPARVLAAAHAVYHDDLVPLQGRPLAYDPAIRSF